jgi:predicted glycosyl hydrolase (DUF1957 family)
MQVAFFLHLYQPPSQKRDIALSVIKESYAPIANILAKKKDVRLTINITGSLLFQFEKYGFTNLIDEYARLIRRGVVEIVGSSAYHAFLPKLPVTHMRRQMMLQKETLLKYFGRDTHIRGFFPPEMAYVPAISEVVQSMGYEWMILDESAIGGVKSGPQIYRDKQGLIYFLRNREISYKIVCGSVTNSLELFDSLKRLDSSPTQQDSYHIIACDGETFGHHNKKGLKTLSSLLSTKKYSLSTISGLINLKLKKMVVVKPRKSSWTILDKKRTFDKPFVRWADNENAIHKMQWKLTDLALSAKHDAKSLRHLDSSLYSCQYWWACARPWWNVEMIEAGAHDLLQSIIESHATASYKKKALSLYHSIVANAFDWMRKGKMQKRIDNENEYDQHHRHFTDQKSISVNQ